MKQVYKCDFCYKTDENPDKILKHEKDCYANPSLKKCWTCIHYEDEGYPISGSMMRCQKGMSYDEQEEYEGNGNCPLWENRN